MARIKVKLGDYEYIIRRNQFWVMEYIEIDEERGTATTQKVATYNDREEARKLVWAHNGWGTPKSALKPRWAR